MNVKGLGPGEHGVEGVPIGVFDPELWTIQMRSKASGSWMFDFNNLDLTRLCNSLNVSTKSLSSNTCSATMVSEFTTILKVVTPAVLGRCPVAEVGVVGEGGCGWTGNMFVPGTVRLPLRLEFFKIPTGCFVEIGE